MNLNSQELRPFLCYLLFKMTKRQHVQNFRIDQLHKIFRKIEEKNSEPWFLKLILLFKEFNSNIDIPIPSNISFLNCFRCPDQKFYNFIQFVQKNQIFDKNKNEKELFLPQQLPTENWKNSKEKINIKKRKLNEDTVVPSSKTIFNENETKKDFLFEKNETIVIDQISSFSQFLNYFEKIVIPNRIGSAFNNKYLVKVLSLDPTNIGMKTEENKYQK